MAKKNDKWKQVGSIRLSKKGKLYIKLDDVSTLNDGCALQIDKPEDNIKALYEKGFMDEEEYERRIDNLPEWLKYEIKQGPDRD